jgi:hypothetical protein
MSTLAGWSGMAHWTTRKQQSHLLPENGNKATENQQRACSNLAELMSLTAIDTE